MSHATQLAVNNRPSPAQEDRVSDSSRSDSGSGLSQKSKSSDSSPNNSPPRLYKHEVHEVAARVAVLDLHQLADKERTLSAGALAAFTHYQDLFLGTTCAPKHYVHLTADEYEEVKIALHEVPVLETYLQESSVCSKFTNYPSGGILLVMVESAIHNTVIKGMSTYFEKCMHRLVDVEPDSKTAELAEQVSRDDPACELELTTMEAEPGGKFHPIDFITTPDGAFTYNDRDTPLIVFEVGYSQDKNRLRDKAEKYALMPTEFEYINTVVSVKLPYQDRAARKNGSSLRENAVVSVYRNKAVDGRPHFEVVHEEFMDQNSQPRTGHDLVLNLSDFCPPDVCLTADDRAFTMSAYDLVAVYKDGLAKQKARDENKAVRKKFIQNYDSTPSDKNDSAGSMSVEGGFDIIAKADDSAVPPEVSATGNTPSRAE